MIEGVDYVIGMYLNSGFFVGEIGVFVGFMMVLFDMFNILIKGKGGYVVVFYEVVDVIVVGV